MLIKKTIVLIALSLITITSSLYAAAREGGYLTAFTGIVHLPNNVNNQGFSQTNYHTGFDIAAAIGYQSGPLRYEGELNYIRARAKTFNDTDPNTQVSIEATAPNGHSDALAGLANIYYDFYNINNIVVPFLGAGVGFAQVRAKLRSKVGASNTPQFNRTNFKFAYQGSAGLSLHLSASIAVNAFYRYLVTTHSRELNKSFQAHMGNIGVTYRI